MTWLNAALGRVFDLLLAPFRDLPPLVGLLVVSLLTAVGMLLLFKRTSDQKKLADVKRRIHACLFEIRLFNDDVVAILRAQGEVLGHTANYLRLSLVPMAVMIVPLLLAMAQLQSHYGYAGLSPGRAFLVKARLAGHGTHARPTASLEAPAGLKVETPAVWLPALSELAWRVRAEAWGQRELVIRVGAETVTKTVQVSRGVRRRSPVRLSPSWIDQILYPAEDPLPAGSALASVTVGYPEASVSVFGWGLHWIVVFLVLSTALAFALRGRFGVVI